MKKKLCEKIDSVFPTGTKIGDLKNVAAASLYLIERDGIKRYLSAVISSISRGEYSLKDAIYALDAFIPMSFSEVDKHNIIKTVKDNRKNRLEIKPHSDSQLKSDEIFVSEDVDKILE